MIRLITFFLLGLTSQAVFAGSSFTYQGRLDQAGQPFSGTVNLQFTLFDAESGCCQLGSVIYRDDWLVSEGLFQVELDFDDSFSGSRWLEVRVDGSLLTPRQKITAAPLAVRALEPWKSSGDTARISADVTIDGSLEVQGTANVNALQLPGQLVLTRAPRVATTGSAGGWLVPTGCPTPGGVLRELDFVLDSPALVIASASGLFNNTGSSNSNGSVVLRLNGVMLTRLHYQSGSGWEGITLPWFGIAEAGAHKLTLTTDLAVGACHNSGQYGRIDVAIFE